MPQWTLSKCLTQKNLKLFLNFFVEAEIKDDMLALVFEANKIGTFLVKKKQVDWLKQAPFKIKSCLQFGWDECGKMHIGKRHNIYLYLCPDLKIETWVEVVENQDGKHFLKDKHLGKEAMKKVLNKKIFKMHIH